MRQSTILVLLLSLVFCISVQAGEKIYFVHTDHLGTPQALTDAAQNTVWKAGDDPFGNAAPEVEQITNNIRFPGQYYDSESGLHYNWNRYYDPSVGRYVTSDPIGLTGGHNTYAYVGANPLRYMDMMGLERVTTFEANLGVWQVWWLQSLGGDCAGNPGGCGNFNLTQKITWTAEATGSCVSDGFTEQVVNGPMEFFLTHLQWFQATLTKYKYKSSNECDPCKLTDHKSEVENFDFPHPGTESLN